MKGVNQNVNPWTPAEDALLERLYPVGGARLVSAATGRTHAACRSRAAFFDVESPYSPRRLKADGRPKMLKEA